MVAIDLGNEQLVIRHQAYSIAYRQRTGVDSSRRQKADSRIETLSEKPLGPASGMVHTSVRLY
jgi:hypothetical protein